ncbi:MAG: helix-turn-helix domain-containing protein [Candidatus Uhrbacteria bacterium]|nr:helix-turn-helix domain-containing protein [Candidatus Uhrbacteria bacterium]MDP3794201.1 helix-turn-helix domain-containing protein [Candidatus Uhrbacteria bacterium]
MFTHKSINPSSHVGHDLRELRERSGWSREAVARETKIHESSIRALEEERWNEILDPVYAERLVRAYVKFLGGKEKYFVQKYRACLREHQLGSHSSERSPRKRHIRALDLAVLSRFVAIGGFLLFALILGGYVYFQVRTIRVPPPLFVETPIDGARLDEPIVRVQGKTSPEATVVVNDRQAIVQTDGTFLIDIDIPRGTVIITISAKRRHGQAATISRRVIFDRPLPSFK